METNKMLREEKDKSEQELQLTQAKVSLKNENRKWDCSDTYDIFSYDILWIYSIIVVLEAVDVFDKYCWVNSQIQTFQLTFCVFQIQKLESDIMPLQQANSELSEKSGMLQAEKKILEEEIKRWKARTQVCERTSKKIKHWTLKGKRTSIIWKVDVLLLQICWEEK